MRGKRGTRRQNASKMRDKRKVHSEIHSADGAAPAAPFSYQSFETVKLTKRPIGEKLVES